MIKLCVFDLDGTLVNSLETIAYYVNQTLNKLGLSSYDIDDIKYMVGDGRALLIERALKGKNAYSAQMFNKACKIYDSAYEADTLYLTKPYDGIVDVVSSLKALGVKTAILSNKPDNVVCDIARIIFGEGFFDFVSGQKENIPIKPNPNMLVSICDKLNINKDECIMIGDTNVDIQTAKNAGVKSIGVLWGFRDEEELQKAGANYIISKPIEMLDIIK